MAQQTWIITFNDISLSEANRYAGQLKDALQGASHHLTVRQQSSIPHTQNLGDMIVATIQDPSAIAAVISVIIVFIRSRRIKINIKVKDGKITEIQANNIDSKNYKETLESLMEQTKSRGVERNDS